MKSTLLLALLIASASAAQETGNVIYQSTGPVIVTASGTASGFTQGAPYSATITNESVQILADGTRIAQSSTGSTARDSQGRTRQEMALPSIGNLSAASAPHLVFIHDPVAQISYTLNLAEKTAQRVPTPTVVSSDDGPAKGGAFAMHVATAGAAPLPPPDAVSGTMGVASGGFFLQKQILTKDEGHSTTEDLGSQTMEGVVAHGVRTTRVIPLGEIGNDRPITIVTEVWTSPDLKTVVYSKRSDPRMGETTFRLSNIVRAEPDPALFAVPPDFKVVDAPQPVLYRAKP